MDNVTAAQCERRMRVFKYMMGVHGLLMTLLVALLISLISSANAASEKATRVESTFSSHAAAEKVMDVNILHTLEEIKAELKDLRKGN